MNRPRRFMNLRSSVIAVAVVVTTWSLWQTWVFSEENKQLRTALAPAGSNTSALGGGEPQAAPAELMEVQLELDEARKRFRAADDQAKNLAAELAIAPGDELKSFGRIEALAKKGVTLVQAIDKRTMDQHAALREGRWINVDAKDITEWLMNTEAIGDLEASPPEIAELYSHALRESLGLDESLAGKLRHLLNTEFEQLRAQGLDRSHRPAEAQEEWYARRDQMLLEAASRIEAHIPPTKRKPHQVAQVLNLGTSFRMRIDKGPDGSPSMTMYYQAPGLPPTQF